MIWPLPTLFQSVTVRDPQDKLRISILSITLFSDILNVNGPQTAPQIMLIKQI